jgi:hypothetical protein
MVPARGGLHCWMRRRRVCPGGNDAFHSVAAGAGSEQRCEDECCNNAHHDACSGIGYASNADKLGQGSGTARPRADRTRYESFPCAARGANVPRSQQLLLAQTTDHSCHRDSCKRYSLLPPSCLSLANTASTFSSSAGFFSSGSGSRRTVVSAAGSSVAPCGSASAGFSLAAR